MNFTEAYAFADGIEDARTRALVLFLLCASLSGVSKNAVELPDFLDYAQQLQRIVSVEANLVVPPWEDESTETFAYVADIANQERRSLVLQAIRRTDVVWNIAQVKLLEAAFEDTRFIGYIFAGGELADE